MLVECQSLDLDEAKVKEYFPVDVVVPVILKIYQDLLGVSFVEITKDVDTWHPGHFVLRSPSYVIADLLSRCSSLPGLE